MLVCGTGLVSFIMPEFNDATTCRIAAFIQEIGIPVRARDIPERTFFPGMKIELGELLIDETRLKHPGDLLHEAGHLAVLTERQRSEIDGDVGPEGGGELMALAWSYAACLHLGLPASVVFHEDSFQGGAETMIDNFAHGRYLGVPGLQRHGLTADAKRAADRGVPPYPAMLAWLRDE